MIYAMGERLEEITIEEAAERPSIYITTTDKCRQMLDAAGILYEGEISMKDVRVCKAETQQDCLYGSLAVPKLLDVLGSRYRILFFINQTNIVLVDNDNFSERLVRRIMRRKIHQGETKEKFLYNFVTEFMNRDLELLDRYEKRIIEMEETVMEDKEMDNFQSKLMPLRKELLTLRSYYDEIADVGKEFIDNENGFFTKKQLKYFGTMTDRAERLVDKSSYLLDYAQQVKDAYQAMVSAKQNNNMQFLTIVSTFFFPLTLITGWYGMNFQDMPELEHGYPWVIGLSAVVVIICIIIFKKKKLF